MIRISRSGRDHETGVRAEVAVSFEPGHGRAALGLLAKIALAVLLQVHDTEAGS